MSNPIQKKRSKPSCIRETRSFEGQIENLDEPQLSQDFILLDEILPTFSTWQYLRKSACVFLFRSQIYNKKYKYIYKKIKNYKKTDYCEYVEIKSFQIFAFNSQHKQNKTRSE